VYILNISIVLHLGHWNYHTNYF